MIPDGHRGPGLLLASHDFDATPKGGFVEVDLGGHIYKLTTNGSAPGLASFAA
jgi:hypothetical protein